MVGVVVCCFFVVCSVCVCWLVSLTFDCWLQLFSFVWILWIAGVFLVVFVVRCLCGFVFPVFVVLLWIGLLPFNMFDVCSDLRFDCVCAY